MFTLSLDQVYSLDSIVFWGYHFGANNGNHPQSVRLEFSTHGGTTCGTPFEVTVGFPATFNLAATSTFTAGDANFVRMPVTDNQFGTGPDGGDRVGIAEMRFLGTPVPEPSSLLLGGLGLLALSRRRRARHRHSIRPDFPDPRPRLPRGGDLFSPGQLLILPDTRNGSPAGHHHQGATSGGSPRQSRAVVQCAESQENRGHF